MRAYRRYLIESGSGAGQPLLKLRLQEVVDVQAWCALNNRRFRLL